MGKNTEGRPADTQGEPFVGSSFVRKQRFNLFSAKKHFTKRKLFIVMAIILVFVTSTILTLTKLSPTREKAVESTINPESEVIVSELEELKNNAPAQSASPEEIADYFDSLAARAADSGDYALAVRAFEQRKSLSSSEMTYLDYFTGATYYCKANDKPKADDALNKSVSLFPPGDNPDEGFYQDSMNTRIETLRKECGI